MGVCAVRVALFADIHANRQALSACLAQARDLGAERIVFLDDYVGYGADPEWAVATVMKLVADGAVAVRGNHDNAVSNPREQLNLEAKVVIEWTCGELGVPERQFLAQLPLTVQEDERLYVHADASNPGAWRYVTDADSAGRSMLTAEARVTYCGRTHRPALYTMSAAGKITAFTPVTGMPVQLLPRRRWLAVLAAAQLAFDLSHPDQVKLTKRSEKLKRDPWSTVLRRRFNKDLKRSIVQPAIATHIASAPIVAVAIDLAGGSAQLNDALRVTAERILATLPSARLACLNVLKINRITIDHSLDEQGHNKQIDRLVGLRHWAAPLKLDESRLTVHALEAVDPAHAILEFVRANRVDHVLIGARPLSAPRSARQHLGESRRRSALHGDDRTASPDQRSGRQLPLRRARLETINHLSQGAALGHVYGRPAGGLCYDRPIAKRRLR